MKILTKNNFGLVYIILLTLSIFTPRYGVLDRMSIQLFLLSATNVFAIISIPIIFKSINIKKIVQNPLIICFGGYILMSLLSMIKSINIVESLVRFNQISTFFLSLCVIVFLANEKAIKLNHVLWVVLITLLYDIGNSALYFYEVTSLFDWSYDFNYLLAGFHGNRNITAASIAFRIPLVIILATRLSNINIKLFLFFILTLSFLDIYLLASRMVLLSIIICLVTIIIISAYVKLKRGYEFYKFNKPILLYYLLPCILAYSLTTYIIDPSDQGDVTNRISSLVGLEDDSKNTRIRYYSHLSEHIFKNPLLGSGIGTWKIFSIKYDRENIQNYIIPYNAHNDVLEVSAETGVIGGLFFLSFFGYLFFYLLKNLQKNHSDPYSYYYSLLMCLPFIIYFIDLNLNFPSSRPFNQYLLLLYIYIILYSNKPLNEKN